MLSFYGVIKADLAAYEGGDDRYLLVSGPHGLRKYSARAAK